MMIIMIITNKICKHILLITFLNEPRLILLHTVKWFHVSLAIQLNIGHLLTHS